jgi:hypothetical protein
MLPFGCDRDVNPSIEVNCVSYVGGPASTAVPPVPPVPVLPDPPAPPDPLVVLAVVAVGEPAGVPSLHATTKAKPMQVEVRRT